MATDLQTELARSAGELIEIGKRPMGEDSDSWTMSSQHCNKDCKCSSWEEVQEGTEEAAYKSVPLIVAVT